MVEARNRSIDAVKGILIFFVVIGHILLGTLDENIIRYVIYTFHMPAFFFVSGYLLNIEKLKAQKYSQILSRYWNRMLFEWLIAWFVYLIYVLRDGFSLLEILRNLYYPWYHLWFVPSLFVMVSVLWIFSHLINDSVRRIILLLIIGIFTYNMAKTGINISPIFNCNHLFFLVIGILSKTYLVDKLNVIGGGKTLLIYLLLVLFMYLIAGYNM